MKLASFDIFDTALIRRCGKPENIFYLLAHRLYPDAEAQRSAFLDWRIRAEAVAWALRAEEVSLSDIYDNLDRKQFVEYTPQECAKAEKEVEAENLCVNRHVASLIEQEREAGATICFISDMYLDSEFLTALLRREHCLMNAEKVYVSCEYKARKSTGQLYQIVQRELKPTQWHHYGDNLHSDVKIPRRFKIQCTHLVSGFSEPELEVSHCSSQTSKYELSILAGLARWIRLSNPPSPELTLAADFVAPAYVPYTLFILQEARRQGIKRLYFLSRDSYILLRAMQQIAPTDIELRYLFVSRQSLLLPFLAEATPERLLEVMDKNTLLRKRVDEILSRLSTTRQELRNLGIDFSYTQITTKEQEQDFMDKIFKCAYFPVLQQKAEAARQMLLAYFEQEMLFDDTNHAMVDVGWLGTSRLMINRLLREAGHRATTFFYYGTRVDVLSEKQGRYISYFTTGQLNTESTALLENYFSASPYPTTIGYHQANGHIEPTFPQGTSYAETPIIGANRLAMEQLMPLVASMRFITGDALHRWANISLTTILRLQAEIDCEPFTHCTENGKSPIAKHLSGSELLDLLLFAKSIVPCDRMSIYLSCARWLRAPLLRYYTLIRTLKTYLFRRFINPAR